VLRWWFWKRRTMNWGLRCWM